MIYSGYKTKIKVLIKLMLIIPITLLMNFDALRTEKGSIDISYMEYFKSFFVGNVTKGDTTTIVFAMSNLIFLVTFVILSGVVIMREFNFMGATLLIRVNKKRRSVLILAENAILGLIAIAYGAIYCATILLIVRLKFFGEFENAFFHEAFAMFIIVVLLTWLFAIIANTLVFFLGETMGIVTVLVAIVLFSIIAISTDNQVLISANPLSFISENKTFAHEILTCVLWVLFTMVFSTFALQFKTSQGRTIRKFS